MSFLERINIFQHFSRWIDRLYDGIPINISPQPLFGPWKEGFALDIHTHSTKVLEEDKLGNVIKWDQRYSNIGEHLYRYKYWKEGWHLYPLVSSIVAFLREKNLTWNIDSIIPIPKSSEHPLTDPVKELAILVGRKMIVAVELQALHKIKATQALKSIYSPEERAEILQNAFEADSEKISGKNILLLDDVYRSGATLQAVSEGISRTAKPKNLYVLTITKTRVNR